MSLKWLSNPFAPGVIHLFMEGRKSSIGGVSFVAGVVRGYFLGDTLYEGESETDAMAAVESKLRRLEPNILRGFMD